MAHHRESNEASLVKKNDAREEMQLDRKTFAAHRNEFERAYRNFVRASRTGLEETLLALWDRIIDLHMPFWFDADADMAKFTFENARSAHICTSTRRFHRPKKTGKPISVTIVLGGFNDEYDDPEDQLIPCDQARKIDCCYFGMGEEEVDLTIYFFRQLIQKPAKKSSSLQQKVKIIPRTSSKRRMPWNSKS